MTAAKIELRASDAQERTLMVVEALLAYATGAQHFIQLVQRLWPKTTWHHGGTHLRLWPHEIDDEESVYVDLSRKEALP